MVTRYDDAIPQLLGVMQEKLTEHMPDRIVVLRDIFGRLAVVSDGIDPALRKSLGKELVERLGAYALDGDPIIDVKTTVGKELLKSPYSLWRVETMADGREITVRTIDRRIVGQDWTLAPDKTQVAAPHRLVFASLKGGVGRSTAVAVTASHLAQLGFDVLVVDLDLEAPGLGSMLLQENKRPRFGALDFLVENGRDGISDQDLQDFVATSDLTDRVKGQGIVDVVPAAGTACLANPQNVLGKIARALVEDPTPRGSVSVRDQTRTFVDRMANRRHYDAVLIDSRAGLSELAAGPILGLGASVLLFGIDQPQTFEGYGYLLAHLSQLPINAATDWRYDLHFVQAKAPATESERRPFQDALFETLADTFYEAEDASHELNASELSEAFSFSVDDPEAPHHALWVGFDGRFLGFDPIRDPTVLDQPVYRASYEEFLAWALKELQLQAGLTGDRA